MAGSAVCVVLVTCPPGRVARRLAEALISRRLAACVNIVPGMTSIFAWKGRVERARELLLVVKTTQGRFSALEQAVRKLHPYEVPEIISLPIRRGYPPYVRWIRESVRPGRRP